MRRLLLIVLLAAVVGGSTGADAGPRLTLDGDGPPAEPKLCQRAVGSRSVNVDGTPRPEALCGSTRRDTFRAVGGGDIVWGYEGDDEIGARNGKPDEIIGGPGDDAGRFDPCDSLVGVERPKRAGGCPGVAARSLLDVEPAPFSDPVAECWRDADGTRVLNVLLEPEVRALDATAAVDWQTVAWRPSVMKKVDGEWALWEHGYWLWDRVYDKQVKAFPGNYWRSFGDDRRSFQWFELSEPGEYAMALSVHWYATAHAPARDEVAWARDHYGPPALLDFSACVFPE